ncbi:unnamed protein product [Adineta steineri]|uniref:Arrestin-like N-terminal domain-containing protein n=1 Tax=Adineta steineri TaxID=433720 RepID=A0A814Z0E6_9BILA|nr:unnamed protein product [Adineta steineri]CAF1510161.1 unnamed protein product [Adineta steineri]CAF3993042.1 unnamed protein product [Adineta steineri]CAF4150777.1 unnamed protein product [Adineta steineri]
MGSNNSVLIDIHLDRTNPLYYAGETVSGTINVHFKAGQIKVDEIILLLSGEVGYTTTRSVNDSNGSSHTETHYHTKSFLKIKNIVESPQPEQKVLVYYAGDYSWRFDIVLPAHLPPSLNLPRSYPHVRYYLKLVMDKPWYKRNTKEILYLTVFPRVNIMQNPQLLVPTIFGNHNRKDVTLKGNINKLAYLQAPSYDFHGDFDCKTFVDVSYGLEFHVKAEGMFTNFNVSIPITIVTESNMDSTKYELDQTMNFSQNSLSYYPQMNNDNSTNPPPSYNSIPFHDYPHKFL